MKTITIKLNEDEFTNIEEIKKIINEHDVVELMGARGVGKSLPTAHYISDILCNDENCKFAYVRLTRDELPTFAGWCSDLDLNKIAENAEKVKLERGKPNAGDLTLTGYDDNDKLIFTRIIGKVFSLESSKNYKSGVYNEYECIVLEEFAQSDMSPSREKLFVRNFLDMVVTVFRKRKKKIILIANNFKTIPLLEQSIDKYTNIPSITGLEFTNPVKVKIFRKSSIKGYDPFLDYLNGELYDDDDFLLDTNEFFIIYSNKNFIIQQHKIYNQKFYVMANKEKHKISYGKNEFLILKYFCQNSNKNEFYYQSTKIEIMFMKEYFSIIAEITKFTCNNNFLIS